MIYQYFNGLGVRMGWADDMYEKGYTREHGGIMDDKPSSPPNSNRYKSSNAQRKSGPNSRWLEYDRTKMIELYEKDISIRIIAKKLNRSPYAIAYQLFNMNKISEDVRNKFKGESRFDTTYRAITSTEYEKSKISNLFTNNVSIKTIATQTNRSSYSIALELYNIKKITKKESDRFKKDLSYDATQSDFKEREKIRKEKIREKTRAKNKALESKLKRDNAQDLLKIVLTVALIVVGIIIAHS